MKRMILVAVSLAGIGLVGCGNSGSASPQAVFDRSSAAAAKSDWKTVFECIDPEKGDEVLFAITFAAGASRTSFGRT